MPSSKPFTAKFINPQPQQDTHQFGTKGLVAFSILGFIAFIGAISILMFNREPQTSQRAAESGLVQSYLQRITMLEAEIEGQKNKGGRESDVMARVLDDLLERQNLLERKQSLIEKIAQSSQSLLKHRISGSANAQKATAPLANKAMPQAPIPLEDLPALRNGAELSIDANVKTRNSSALPLPKASPTTKVSEIHRNLLKINNWQEGVMLGLEKDLLQAHKKNLALIEQIGLPLEKISKATSAKASQAVGGPLVPFHPEKETGNTKYVLTRLVKLSTEAIQVQDYVKSLPLLSPLANEAEITSTFGGRYDPFTRGLAMHSGLDLKASSGTNVTSTAAGTIIGSGYEGGYGLRVEIDHGNGITTRYAHLSQTHVQEGTTVKAGQLIGAVGSTGRSTGPHLHYEIRLNDEATDPLKFLRASGR